MSNTHLVPDFASELQAIMGDVQAPCILSTTWPVVPVSSLTLAAFATHGFVKDGSQLVYVNQAAAPVTLSGADGQFWVALHRNTSAAVASWTRQPGTHYLWRSNPTKPAEPSGGLILSQVTVAGGIITAVSQATIPNTPLSLQDAETVAITGGTISVGTLVSTGTLGVGGVANIAGQVGIQQASHPSFPLSILYYRLTQSGLVMQAADQNTNNVTVLFLNTASAVVGSIDAGAVSTTYNTASDARMKEAIAALEGALDTILALRPVTFRWQVDGSPGRGFLAHELQAVVPESVTGEPNAVNPDGSISPQQVDHSRLVVYLVGAVQELAARVATLEAALP